MKFSKSHGYSSNLLVVDGLWGNGKSLMASLLTSVKNSEMWRYNMTFDHLPIYYGGNKIEESAAVSLIRTLFDKVTYNSFLSREVNLRINDETCVLKHPNRLGSIKKIFSSGVSDGLVIRDSANIIIPVMTHMASISNDLFFRALSGRVKVICCVRNPLYMLDHWSNYIERVMSDPREFTPKITYNCVDIPWFAEGWEDEYISANSYEKSIKSIGVIYDMLADKIYKMPSYEQENYMVVFFEDLVVDTDLTFSSVMQFLGCDYDKRRYKMEKKNNSVPRMNLYSSDGYDAKDWSSSSVRDENKIIREEYFVGRYKDLVSDVYYNQLLSLIDKYSNFKRCYADKSWSGAGDKLTRV